MSLLESAILSLCLSHSAQTNVACKDAIQAGAKQSGFEQTMDTFEHRETLYMESGVFSTMGKENAEIVGGTLWVANAAATKRASLSLPNLGLCDNLALEANNKESNLMFKWFW